MKILSPLWKIWEHQFRAKNSYSFEVFSSENVLDLLAEQYGTDKGGRNAPILNADRERHNYSQVYHQIFGARRPAVTNVLECGIGSKNQNVRGNMGPLAEEGASLRVWREYFPNAEIVGLDIDFECLFSEDRISTFQCDQTNSQQVSDLLGGLNKRFDLIVDDGLHLFEAGRAFFLAAREFLSPGGYFFVEDVHAKDMLKWREFASGLSQLETSFVLLSKPGGARADNRMVIFGPAT